MRLKITFQRRVALSVLLHLVGAFGLSPELAHKLGAAPVEWWVTSNTGTNAPGTETYPSGIAVDQQGNIFVTGTAIPQWEPYDSDLFTVKYSGTTGMLLWDRRYTSPKRSTNPTNSVDGSVAMALDGRGDAVVTGFRATISGRLLFYTAKYAGTNGTVVWEQFYFGDLYTTLAKSRSVAFDANGDVAVTGVAVGSSAQDCYTAKYSGTNGVLIWEKRTAFAGNESPSKVLFDSRGDVVISAYMTRTNPASNNSLETGSYIAKYAATDGELIWERFQPGASSSAGMVIDASDNVVISGTVASQASGDDYYTAKYSAENGTILWEQRHDAGVGPESRTDWASAIIADGSGNIIVTGTSFGFGSRKRSTVKYTGDDGRMLWQTTSYEKNYTSGSAVTCDANGDVIVTGALSVSSNGTGNFIYTSKYSGMTGSLLWEASYLRWDSVPTVSL